MQLINRTLGPTSEAVEALAASGPRPVGALANIAGIASPVPFLEVDVDLWHKVIDVNIA